MKNKIIQGDSLQVLKTLESESVDCVITSPPYFGLRDYGVKGQVGLEETPELFVKSMVSIFHEAKRVLKATGTLWLNLGDSYAGSGKGQTRQGSTDPRRDKMLGMKLKNSSKGFPNIKAKDMIGIPWAVAFALRNDGWYLRQDLIWHKNNAMPSSVVDRLSNKYEHVFLFSKSPTYYFDLDSIRIPFETDEKRPDGNTRAREKGYNTKIGTKTRLQEEQSRTFGIRRNPESEYVRNPKGKNPGDVWTLNSEPSKERHVAMFPQKLIEPMIIAGCPKDGIVLDIFMGAGTTGLVAKKLGRSWLGIELNPEYIKIAEDRINGQTPPML